MNPNAFVGMILACSSLLWAVGCSDFKTRFHILSFARPEAPEHYSDAFPEGIFSVDAAGNWDILFRKEQVIDREMPTGAADPAPGDSADSESAAETAPIEHRGARLRQYVHLRIFWRPIPGTTFAEKTQTNAAILYCLQEESGAIAYEGAGFVYFTASRNGRSIRGEIETAGLSPTRMVGGPFDYFGACRLTGPFAAREDKRAVIEALQELRRQLGPPITAGPVRESR